MALLSYLDVETPLLDTVYEWIEEFSCTFLSGEKSRVPYK